MIDGFEKCFIHVTIWTLIALTELAVGQLYPYKMVFFNYQMETQGKLICFLYGGRMFLTLPSADRSCGGEVKHR